MFWCFCSMFLCFGDRLGRRHTFPLGLCWLDIMRAKVIQSLLTIDGQISGKFGGSVMITGPYGYLGIPSSVGMSVSTVGVSVGGFVRDGLRVGGMGFKVAALVGCIVEGCIVGVTM